MFTIEVGDNLAFVLALTSVGWIITRMAKR